jgi:CRISPR-associated protein Csm2
MSSISLWKDRENKIIDPLLFSKVAEDMAISLGGDSRKNKGSQLRRFFDEVVRLNDTAKADTVEMVVVLPYLHMLIAKAAYAKGRKLVTDDFVQLMRDCINQIENKDDLRVFTNFFESLMAFYKLHGPK